MTNATNDATVLVSPVGMNFGGSSDSVAYCKFHLPIDFDSADANQPYIRVTGWAITDTTCGAGGTSRTVRLEATSRAFADSTFPTDAWPTEDFADATLTCTPNYFGVGLDGIKSDKLFILYIDATADGSDWDSKDFVEIKIRRNTGTDTYADVFHVAHVDLVYRTIN